MVYRRNEHVHDVPDNTADDQWINSRIHDAEKQRGIGKHYTERDRVGERDGDNDHIS